MDRSHLVALIIKIVRDIYDPSGAARNLVVDENTALFGRDGLFDSVGLVSVILAVEQDVSSSSGKAITIADERAMSQTRSPFLTVESLATYTAELLREAGAPENG
jgi:acyl carrier protein